jgi:hexosaminidase
MVFIQLFKNYSSLTKCELSKASWNDPGPTASTPLEIFYEIKEGLPIVLAANWQAAPRPMHLTEDQFNAAFPTLQRTAPGQNMNRFVPSKGALVIEYDLTQVPTNGQSVNVPDGSGNGYNGVLTNGVIRTPLTSKGHNFTMLIELASAAQPGTFLSGPDDSLGFVGAGSGLTLAFTSTNITYTLPNVTLPVGSEENPVKIAITATEKGTSAFVNGQHVGDFMVTVPNGNVAPMAFVAPIQSIGMAGVSLQRFAIWDGLQDVSQL